MTDHEHQHKWLVELLKDADASPRLNQYEQDFVISMIEREAAKGVNVWISDAQMRVLKEIEQKVHAT